MKILMLLDHQFPPDIRVENEAISLSEQGHEVFLLTYQFDNIMLRKENYKNFSVLRFPFSNFKAKKFRAMVTILPLLKNVWIKNIEEVYNDIKFDVIHAHDLYMAEPALEFARKYPVKVVIDLHETWINAIKELEFTKKFPLRYLINFKKWEYYEKTWLEKADKIIVVTKDVPRYYLNKYNIQIDKFFCVPNYLNLKTFKTQGNITYPDHSLIKFVYIGGLDYQRGLDIIIKAFSNVIKFYKNVHLTIGGYGNAVSDLKQLTSQLNLNQFISFLGYVPPSQIAEIITNAHVGLVPHRRSLHTDLTIPHKIFQYLILGRPVFSSDIPILKEIIENNNCGFVFKNESIEDATNQLLQIIGNIQNLKSMGENGRKAVLEKYNWSVSEKELIRLYESL